MEEFCEKQRNPNEPARHWNARKQFIVNNWDRYHGNQLASLAMVWLNIEFYGCTYPPELMQRVQEMAKGITIDVTPLDVESKPTIPVRTSQLFDKSKPTPTPEVISTTSEPVVCRLTAKREGNRFQKAGKRWIVQETANTECVRLDEKRRKEMPCRGWYTALADGGTAELEQSNCNDIACQSRNISTHDPVISALAENLIWEPYTTKKNRRASSLRRLNPAAMKVPLKRHIEYISVPPPLGKIKTRWLCNMYYDEILVGSAEGENKHRSRIGAADRAVSMLENLNYAVVNANKVSVMGRNYSKELVPLDEVQDGISNNNMTVSALVDSTFKKKHVPIVFETSDDVRTVDRETGYVCTTTIGGNTVATGIHMDKSKARRASADIALAFLRDKSSKMKTNLDKFKNVVNECDIKASDLGIRRKNEVSDSIKPIRATNSVTKPSEASHSVIKSSKGPHNVIEPSKACHSVPVNPPKEALHENLMQKTSPINVQVGNLDNFILTEPSSPARAVSILIDSAFSNNVPIEFKIDSAKMINGVKGFMCSTIVNGVIVATGTSRFTAQARNVSANNALAVLRNQSSNIKEGHDNTRNVGIEPDSKASDFVVAENIVNEPDSKVSDLVIKLENTASDSVVAENAVNAPDDIKASDFVFKLENTSSDTAAFMESDSVVPENVGIETESKASDVVVKLENTASDSIVTENVVNKPDIKASDFVIKLENMVSDSVVAESAGIESEGKASDVVIKLENTASHFVTAENAVIEPDSKASDVVIKLENTASDFVIKENAVYEPNSKAPDLVNKLEDMGSDSIVAENTGSKVSDVVIKLENTASDSVTAEHVVTEPDIKAFDVVIKLENTASDSVIKENVVAEPDFKAFDAVIKLENTASDSIVAENAVNETDIKAFDVVIQPENTASDSVIKENVVAENTVNEPDIKASDFIFKLENTTSDHVTTPDIAFNVVDVENTVDSNSKASDVIKLEKMVSDSVVTVETVVIKPDSKASDFVVAENAFNEPDTKVTDVVIKLENMASDLVIAPDIGSDSVVGENVVIAPDSKASDFVVAENDVNDSDLEVSDFVIELENMASDPVIASEMASDFVVAENAVDSNSEASDVVIKLENTATDSVVTENAVIEPDSKASDFVVGEDAVNDSDFEVSDFVIGFENTASDSLMTSHFVPVISPEKIDEPLKQKTSPITVQNHSVVVPSKASDSDIEPSEVSHSDIEPSKASHSEIEPSKVSHSDIEPSKASHSEIEPSKVSHSDIEPSKASHSEIEPSKVSHFDIEPSKASHSGIEPSKASHFAAVPSKASHSDIEPSRAPHSDIEPSNASHSDIKPSKVSQSDIEPSKASDCDIVPRKASHSVIVPSKVSHSDIEPSKASYSDIEPSKASHSVIVPSKVSISDIEPSKASHSVIVPSKVSHSDIEPSKASHSVVETIQAFESVPVNPSIDALHENLKQKKSSPINIQNQVLDDFTLFEPSTPLPSASILIDSALINDVPIEFESDGFVCSTIINGTTVATGTHMNKREARNVSADNALALLRQHSSNLKRKFNDTQKVIKPNSEASDSSVFSPKITDDQKKEKTPPINVLNSILDNFVLLEPLVRSPAVSILVNTAFKNKVPIEFETVYTCSTIIDGTTVATGTHVDKTQARNVSADNALALLRHHSSHMKRRLNNTQKVIETNSEASDSSSFSSKKTNQRLKRKTLPTNVINSISNNFILVEPSTPAPAVSILVNSAFSNNVPIEFVTSDDFTTVDGETGYVCSTTIDGTTVATGIHMNKREAKNVSADNALAFLRHRSSRTRKKPDSTQNVYKPSKEFHSGPMKKASHYSLINKRSKVHSVIEPKKASYFGPPNPPKKATNENSKQKTSPTMTQTGTLVNFSLVEPSTPSPAVSILVNSSFSNNVPIEFVTSDNFRTVDGETGYVCSTIINGTTVATGIHANKREARNVSADNALVFLRGQSCNMKKIPDSTQNVIKPCIKVPHSVIEPSKATHANSEPSKATHANSEPSKATHSVIEPSKATHSVPVNPPAKAINENLEQKASPIIIQNGILDNFTLMEPANPDPSVSILVNSAFKNNVPIKFVTSNNFMTVDGETGYVCSTIIDGTTVATGIHINKREARNVSADNALALLRGKSSNLKKNLDSTQNVIQPSRGPHSVIEPSTVNPPKTLVNENLKQKTSTVIIQNQVLENFTLVEPPNPAPPVSILIDSAFKNHVPIEFEISDNIITFDGETMYVCKTIINGITIATGIHTDMREVKNVSANYALALLRDQSLNPKKTPDNTRNVATELDDKASGSVTKTGKTKIGPVNPSKNVKYPPIKETNVGYKMLRQMGWEGGALQKDGIVDPIQASLKFSRGGLGFVDLKPKFSKPLKPKVSQPPNPKVTQPPNPKVTQPPNPSPKLSKKKQRALKRRMKKHRRYERLKLVQENAFNQDDRTDEEMCNEEIYHEEIWDEEVWDVERPQTFELQNLVPVIEALYPKFAYD
ncbi:uncharacterized protein [Asterias amurensis]|uniref:uncharacterized protein n=1 Tax=Asterias amurensis TaxID=7602 RepID=UPI003AB5B181